MDVKKTIALKGGHWFHYDMTDEEAEQYPDATFDIQEVRIEPLAVSVIGMNHGSLPLGDTSRYDVQSPRKAVPRRRHRVDLRLGRGNFTRVSMAVRTKKFRTDDLAC